MDEDKMVSALEDAHRLLGRDGTLIDIHPAPGTADVEVHRAGDVVVAERASTSDGVGEQYADEALATIIACGLFTAERRAHFDFRVYASSVSELRDFLDEGDAHARQAAGDTNEPNESELYERVQQVIGAGGTASEVAYHERARLTRLRPVAHSVGSP